MFHDSLKYIGNFQRYNLLITLVNRRVSGILSTIFRRIIVKRSIQPTMPTSERSKAIKNESLVCINVNGNTKNAEKITSTVRK